MGTVLSVIGSSVCSVSERHYPELRIYGLQTVRDSAAYTKHVITYGEPHPCRCELNADMLEEGVVVARKIAMVRFGELVSRLSQSMYNLI